MQGTKVAVKEAHNELAHILVVDDERSICELLEITFRKEGHRVEVAHSVEAAKRKLESQIFDIIISDVRMPGTTGVDLLKFTKEISPNSFFLLITGVPTVETAIAAINSGADRYVIKDHELVDQFRRAVKEVAESLKLKKEAGYLRRELRRLTGLDNIIGHSPKMRAIFDLIQTIAPQTSRVLITGESGTGKELVARAIHENSLRAQAPFITINCGAFPETLLESELFGYMKGAFTGANENRQGLFQAAHGGTLFMDEIGNMSLTMQVKLYRVLQEGKVRPIGSTEEIDVDVRIIAATNKEFEKEIAEGRLPRGLVLPLERYPYSVARTPRTPRGHSAARSAFSGKIPKVDGKAHRGAIAGSGTAARVLRLAGKRARIGKHHGACRRPRNQRRDFSSRAPRPHRRLLYHGRFRSQVCKRDAFSSRRPGLRESHRRYRAPLFDRRSRKRRRGPHSRRRPPEDYLQVLPALRKKAQRLIQYDLQREILNVLDFQHSSPLSLPAYGFRRACRAPREDPDNAKLYHPIGGFHSPSFHGFSPLCFRIRDRKHRPLHSDWPRFRLAFRSHHRTDRLDWARLSVPVRGGVQDFRHLHSCFCVRPPSSKQCLCFSYLYSPVSTLCAYDGSCRRLQRYPLAWQNHCLRVPENAIASLSSGKNREKMTVYLPQPSMPAILKTRPTRELQHISRELPAATPGFAPIRGCSASQCCRSTATGDMDTATAGKAECPFAPARSDEKRHICLENTVWQGYPGVFSTFFSFVF